MRGFFRIVTTIATACVLSVSALAGTVSGDLIKWHPVTVDFAGPTHNEFDTSPNPFLDYRLQVTFTAAATGKTYDVPGFFAGDGSGGATGGVWRVIFNPDEAGLWNYSASYRTGTEVAVDLSPAAGTPTSFDGDAGNFVIADTDPNAEGFKKFGRLESVGTYYLKFRDGGYWLKLGSNNPENFLGYDGFDNTPFAWHDYDNHVQDWNPGDPDWDSSYNPGPNDGRGIIGALNYMNEIGLNSIYFMPTNIGADGKDAWPYASESIDRDGSPSNDNVHFDISKLEQWDIVFTHAQRKDIFLHFVFGDREPANKNELDNATLGPERKLFYREMIARFGYHNALQWNISEEFNLSLPLPPSVIKEFGTYIKAVDPYDFPVTVHPHGNTYVNALDPFLGDDWFKIMSVQTWQRPDDIDGAIEYFRAETAAEGNPIPVMIDESKGMNTTPLVEYRKRIIWDALLSGGGLEMFKQNGDSTFDDFRVYEQYFQTAWHARKFVEENLPFWEMAPDDGLLTGEDGVWGGGEVFAKAGEIYAIFLPSANPVPNFDLSASTDPFEQSWYNPRTGQFEGSITTVSGGSTISLGQPPSDTDNDWVVLLRNQTIGFEPTLFNGQPSGLLPAGTAQTDISISSNVNATCKYDTVPGTDYAAMPGAFAVTGGTAHSTTVTGLADSTGYTYYVRCADLSGSPNTDDFPISFAIDSPLGDLLGDRARWFANEGSGPTIDDSSGNGNVGTLTAGAQWGTGRIGQGLSFDGSAAYVSVADSSTLAYENMPGAAVAMWVRPDRLDHTDDQTLYGQWNSQKAERPFQVLLLPDNRWQCRTNNSNGNATSTSQAALGTWTHVACVWSPAGLQVFIDGALEATDNGVEPQLDSNSANHTLGARDKSGSLSQHFQGALDEIHIFGAAPSAAEINQLYFWPNLPEPIRSNGAPTGLLPAGTTQTTLSLNTDIAANCRYSTAPDTDYAAMVGTFDSTGGTAHSTLMSGLTDGTSYTFYVRCADLVGTPNTTDFPITFAVDAIIPIPPTLSGGMPTGNLPSGTSQVTMSLASDIPATCRYETVPDIEYASMTNTFTTTGGLAHSTLVTGLLNGQSYQYFVRCASSAGVPTTSDFVIAFAVSDPTASPSGVYFPPPGETMASQFPKSPADVGLSSTIVTDLQSVVVSGSWALWRHGYLVHVEGSLNGNVDVQSVRKTVHAATAGVALYRGLIPSLDQKISIWNPELTGLDADATWRHVMTQTSAFDEPALAPGSLWAYSDANPLQLNRALARVWGNPDYDTGYTALLADALMTDIGATGWVSFPAPDGISLQMDLEDMGRIGLLLARGGEWDGTRLMSQWHASQMLSKQTAGITPNYANANDGMTGMSIADFPESPYGFMTWSNAVQDLYPAADATWGVALGANGHYIVMDPASGLVLAMLDAQLTQPPGNPPGWPTQVRSAVETLQAGISGANPLITIDLSPPSAPATPAATLSGVDVNVTWAASVDPETGVQRYDVYRNAVGQAAAPVGSVSGASLAFLDTTTLDNTAYEYQVVAVNGDGVESLPSAIAAIMTPDTAPTAPTGLTATAGDAQVALAWSANAEPDVVGYRVMRGTTAGGPYFDVSGLVAVTSYDDASAANGVTYYYVITAEDAAANVSGNSAETNATPQASVQPVAWWPLDEGSGAVAADAAGASDGTVVGASWVAGVTGQALQFDGASHRVEIADTAALDYSGFSGATVALWANPGRLDHTSEQTLYGHWSGSKSQRPFQIQLLENNQFECRANHNNAVVHSFQLGVVGTWTHVACVWTPAGLDIYIDGVLEATDTTVEPALDGNGGLHTLGAREKSGALSQFYLGAIDDVRVYNVALTPAEVAAIAAGGPGGGNAPPTADAGADAAIRLPLSTVNLDGTVSDDGQPIPNPVTTWSVVSGPGGVSFGNASAVDTTATFSAAGSYVLQLEADDTELQASDTVTITVEGLPVLTTLDVQPVAVSLEPAATQQFTATGLDQYGDPIATTPVWTATGGSIDAGGLYTAGGTFGLFTVTATDGVIVDGASVTIAGSPPTAEAGGPYFGAEGGSVTVDGSGSSDPNNDIVAWDWDYDNDGQYDDATGETAAYPATASGVFTIGLQVFDIDGASSTDTAQMTINNVAPTASAGGPYSIDQGQVANLDASGSSDPGNDIVSYEWDLDADGQYDDATGATTTFNGAAPGIYAIGVRVTDADTASNVDSATVAVADTAPGAPTGVTAAGSDGQVALNWNANGEPDVLGYRVYRSSTSGGPYTDISGLAAGTNYDDLAVTNGTTYFYVISAEDAAANASANSAEVSATPQSVAQATAWWPLDEGSGTLAADAVGSSDGTLVGGTWVDAVSGKGLDLNGSSDHVVIANTPALDIAGTQITLAAWINPDNAGNSGGSRVISKRTDAGGGDVYSMYTQQNRLRFRLDTIDMVSVGTFTTNQWIHVAMVYDGVDKRIYLNGALDAATPQAKTDPIDASTRPVILGQREDEGRFFNGQIDEVRIYATALSPSEVALIAAGGPPQGDFVDITSTAGIGGPGDGGHGLMFADIDDDGLPDLYATLLLQNTGTRVDLFHRNLGGNVFAEEAALRGIADLDGGSHGSVWADLDNDGDFDLVNGSTWDVQGTFGFPVANNVYRNDAGFFTDVTPAAIASNPRETRGITAYDMDADGDLDLFGVPGSQTPGGNEAYENDGGLQFSAYVGGGDLTSAIAMQGLTDTDYDGDGDIDILSANRGGAFAILQNDGNGVFTQITPSSIGFSDNAGDGITTADVDNDGDLDVLLVSDGTGRLYERTGTTYTFRQTFSGVNGYMGGFADLDNDTDQDLVFAGGGAVFLNDGIGNFSTGQSVPTLGNAADPRAIAFADIDNDGDPDFAMAYKSSINQLIRNDIAGGNWIKVRLLSPDGQRGAFGARTYVYAAGDLDGTLIGMRESKGNHGYLGQDDPKVHVGLGALSSIDIRVDFLDGTSKTMTGVAVNQEILIDGALP